MARRVAAFDLKGVSIAWRCRWEVSAPNTLSFQEPTVVSIHRMFDRLQQTSAS